MIKTKNIYIWVIVILFIAAGIYLLASQDSKPGELDQFARCLGEKGAVFYGAFWCPHCQDQKAAFGKSAKFIPYVECSTPDGKSQTSECKEKGIEGYPTWVFADGSRDSRNIPLTELAEKTGCELPVNN